ncbi:hypothetical protein [Lacrimispora sp.]
MDILTRNVSGVYIDGDEIKRYHDTRYQKEFMATLQCVMAE